MLMNCCAAQLLHRRAENSHQDAHNEGALESWDRTSSKKQTSNLVDDDALWIEVDREVFGSAGEQISIFSRNHLAHAAAAWP